MSDNNHDLDVLFINGINTGFGGSVAESNKTWVASFRKNGVLFDVLDTVPRFSLTKKSRWYFLLLSLYFMPGTLFRIVTAPIFEFAYKLSPFVAINFIRIILTRRPRRVIFSHHSVCYLSLFCSRAKRIFLIHDLMYVRSRSKGASRQMQRLFFNLELSIYRLAPTLLVQSYHEWRVLRYFLNNRIYLISCCDLNSTTMPSKRRSSLAVISDWRRPENVHGATLFFSTTAAKTYDGKELSFRFYGFGSRALVDCLESIGVASNVVIDDGGTFKDVSDITEGYFFVPIYQGAGIKRKTLEALCSGRMVIGTKAAFIGLPAWLITDVTWCINTIDDFQALPSLPDEQTFDRALGGLSRRFCSIGEIHDLHQ